MSADKKSQLPHLGPEELEQIDLWLASNSDQIPEVVKYALSHYNHLMVGLGGNAHQLRSTLIQLRLALGIIPSSERRRSSGDPIGAMGQAGDAKPRNAKEKLELSIANLNRLKDWHKDLARRSARRSKRLRDKLVAMDDAERTDEERVQDQKESGEFVARLQLGDGPDPVFESPKQAFMLGNDVRVEEEQALALVDPELLQGEQIVERLIDQRTRYDFDITLTEIKIGVEKVIVKDADSSTRIISASTRGIGPARSDVTWEFLANLAIMVAQYAMPFNRLAALLSSPGKRFTAATMSKKFAYVAQRFVPVYLQNFRSLANAPIYSGDDTKTRVTEFDRHLKRTQAGGTDDPPWKDFATADVAEKTLQREVTSGLGVQTSFLLGFESGRKDGSGAKRELKTSVIWGRSEADNPRSALIFYRSHIGAFGNLLSICLGARDPDKKSVIVQSDLSSANLVNDHQLTECFSIEYAGCASHARRPFAIHETDAPDYCSAMLHLFKGLYIDERGLDIVGRNEANIRAVRDIDSRQTWEEIRELAIMIGEDWPKKSPIGGAANYIIRHYKKLTAYLDNPSIAISNDFSERMLRMENLIEANSMFRTSLEGRFALDINRSILQTAIAAQVPLQDYVAYVMRASAEDVAARPEEYTALAYSRRLAMESESADKANV